MFERLTLRNFQVHKKFVVDLDPVVTFIGDTDVGKSTILRALRWLCLNQPDGNEMINWDANWTRVDLELDNGRLITRKRGSKNLYWLDGKKFVAFGRAVPDEIAKVLNVSDLNFQFQHDPLFWLSLNAGQVSKALNQIVNLGSIDTTLSNIASKLRKCRAEVDVSEGRLETAIARKKELAWVPDVDRAVRRLEDLDARVSQVADRGRNLYDLCEGLTECRMGLKTRRKAATAGNQCVSLGDRLTTLGGRAGRLRELVSDIAVARSNLAVAISDCTRAKRTLNTFAKDRLCPSCERPF